jgi:hypothetical protein
MTNEEADAYLAERVMGWRDAQYWDNVGSCVRCWEDSNGIDIDYCDWKPSVSLDDAMQAAEEVGLNLDGYWFHLEWRPGHADSPLWCAYWCAPFLNENKHAGFGETPALAVCRAVISAHEARK